MVSGVPHVQAAGRGGTERLLTLDRTAQFTDTLVIGHGVRATRLSEGRDAKSERLPHLAEEQQPEEGCDGDALCR